MKELYKHIMTNHTKEELKDIGIYLIVNLINEKGYIGSTTSTFYNRWSQHVYQLLRKEHSNKHMQNSWNKHGYQNFEFKIIHKIENINEFDDIINIEQEYIDNFNTMYPYGYNIIPADSTRYDKKDQHFKSYKKITRKEKKQNFLLNKYMPNQAIFYKIKDLFCINNESRHFICNLFNIDIELFDMIMSTDIYEDILNNYDFSNYINIYDIKKPSFTEDSRLMYSRKPCYNCIFYKVKGDKCNYFNIYMPNNHVVECNYAIQDTLFDEECVSENDLEYDIDDLEIYYNYNNIDDITEKYLNGGYFG